MWFTTADPGVLQYSHTSSVVRDNLYHKAPRAQLLVEFATTSASAIAPVQGATVLMALCAALALVIQRSSDLTRYAPETFCRNDSPKLLRWIVFDLFTDIHPSLNVAWFQRELGLGQNWAPQKIRWLSLMYQQLLGLDLDGDHRYPWHIGCMRQDGRLAVGQPRSAGSWSINWSSNFCTKIYTCTYYVSTYIYIERERESYRDWFIYTHHSILILILESCETTQAPAQLAQPSCASFASHPNSNARISKPG